MNKLFIFGCLAIIFFIRSGQASQLTFVTSSKAIIYADRQLSTPIGYLPNGKKVRVGEGLQRGGKILPILIAGKVAYIKVEDLELREKYQGISNTRHKIEHNTDSQFTIPEDKLSENIFFIASLSSISAGQTTSQEGVGIRSSSNNEDRQDSDDSVTSLREYTVYIEHRQPYGRFSWGLGVGLLQSTKVGETIEGLILRGTVKGSFFKTRLITLDGVLEPYFSGDINLGTAPPADENNSSDNLVASLYGIRIALQANLFPLSRYGVVVGAGIEKSYFSQSSTTETINNYSLNLNSNIIYAGISYKF